MRRNLRPLLASVVLLVVLSACTDDTTATRPSETSNTATTISVDTSGATSSTTSAPASTTASTTTSTSEPAADCPVVTFENLPAPWDPTIKPEQGDGSGLPGTHIVRPGAFINLFPGGSIWAPSSPESIMVDGRPSQIGTVEDGLSVRVTVTGTCDKFDFVAYGVTDGELRAVMATVRFG